MKGSESLKQSSRVLSTLILALRALFIIPLVRFNSVTIIFSEQKKD